MNCTKFAKKSDSKFSKYIYKKKIALKLKHSFEWIIEC